MSIIYTDNHKCEKCEKIFEWNHFEFKKNRPEDHQFEVEKRPSNKTYTHRFNKRSDGLTYVEVNCPHCNFDNHFKL